MEGVRVGESDWVGASAIVLDLVWVSEKGCERVRERHFYLCMLHIGIYVCDNVYMYVFACVCVRARLSLSSCVCVCVCVCL